MTDFENHEPETEMWIYMTDIPMDYEEVNLQKIFNILGNDELIIKEVRFVPCFQNPYQLKCAYILFYNWFTCSKEISNIEAYFLNRTYYTYRHEEKRTWFELFQLPRINYYKIYYSKKGLSRKKCAKKWDLIKTHFYKMEELEKRIILLEKRLNGPIENIVDDPMDRDYELMEENINL